MNKQKFLELISDPEAISTKNIDELEEIVKTFPFFHIAHALLAKGYHNTQSREFLPKLHHAAVYAANRKVLKDLIEGRPDLKTRADAGHEATEKPEVVGVKQKASGASIEKTEDTAEKGEKQGTNQAIDSLEGTKNPDADIKQKELKHKLDQKITEAEELIKKSGKSKGYHPNQDISMPEENPEENKVDQLHEELQENLQKLKEQKKFGVEENNLASKDRDKALAGENKRIKQQIEIIDKFLKTAPNFSRPDVEGDDPKKQEDLSLKSTTANQDTISENLARIMIRQGKTEKAINIYNQLMLKFPEKKAYFASRIEKLKKE